MLRLTVEGGSALKQPDMHSAKRFLRPITYGVSSGGAACFLLLLLMSVLMGMRDMPQAMVSLFATISFVAGGFLAGYVTALLSQEKGLFLGLCCGAILFFVLLCAGMAVSGGAPGMQALTKLLAVLFASAIGGVLGVNKKKKFK